MDATTFDELIKRLATTRLTRLTALRGLAIGGLAALTGVGLSAEEAVAKKNHENKVKVCKCPDANAANCRTDKVKKSRAKKQARKACNYKGKCQAGVSGCPTGAPNPGFACTNNNDCTGGLVCLGQTCQACTADAQCSRNLVCLSGTCQAPQPGPGPACVDNTQCSGGQVCDVSGQCRPCHFDFECPGQICTSGACRGGEGCTQPTDCPSPLECVPSPESCLLPPMQYGLVEPGTCAPVSNDVCGPITLDGQTFNTTCLLGACVLLCNSFDAANACADAPGTCVDSFCFARD
jgi:hypothetical protein